MARSYVVRKFQSGRNNQGKPFYNYSLTVPSEYAEQLPAGMRYGCEVLPEITLPDDDSVPPEFRGRTVKGILFTPQDGDEKPSMPEWAKKPSNGSAKPRRSRPGKPSE